MKFVVGDLATFRGGSKTIREVREVTNKGYYLSDSNGNKTCVLWHEWELTLVAPAKVRNSKLYKLLNEEYVEET